MSMQWRETVLEEPHSAVSKPWRTSKPSVLWYTLWDHLPQLTSSRNCSQCHRPFLLSLWQFPEIWNQLRFHSGLGVTGLFLNGEAIGLGSRGSQDKSEVKDGGENEDGRKCLDFFPTALGPRWRLLDFLFIKERRTGTGRVEQVTLFYKVWPLSPWNWAFTLWGRILSTWV